MTLHHLERTGSTMDEAKALASKGAPSFTVVVADLQDAGRGRTSGRTWVAGSGESLLCTVLIRYAAFSAIPPALSLRAGLAAAQAIEATDSLLEGRVLIKWPNDVLIGTAPTREEGKGAEREVELAPARKICGVLCESDGQVVYIGTGINLSQPSFPPGLSAKATSFRMETGHSPDRFALLDAYIHFLRIVLDDQSGAWMPALDRRLFLKDCRVRFEAGAAGSGRITEGILKGIAGNGALLILEDGQGEPLAHMNGELLVYGQASKSPDF